LLGEITIDVANLAATKQMKTFRLTCFGKPEEGQVTLSAKFIPREALFPYASDDNHTNGSNEPSFLILTVHKVTLLRKAEWAGVGKNDVYVQAYRYPKGGQLDWRKQLPKPQMKTKLHVGESTFLFAFTIPANSPGLAKLNVSDSAPGLTKPNVTNYAYIRTIPVCLC
jgi:hypothetical protein